ncbi:MAG: hypothetical protein U0992_04195 [Planctomycetaceae bacterium]
MSAERFRSFAVLAASSVVTFALLAVHSRAEPTLPPPAPETTIESAPLPPAPDADAGAPPSDPGAEHDVLTRGPIHEAFAEQYNDEPSPGLVIPKAPPEPIDELPPETMPDGNNVQWIPGYWGWDDDRQDFIWVSGLWRDVPPGQRWVPGYWNQSPRGWQWVSGFWTGAEHAELDYLPQPPPTLEQGPNVAAPSEDQFWVPGTWSYVDTGYRWRPGYWAPAYDDWVWVPDRYIWTPYGFVFAPGYYDYRLPVRAVAFAPVYFSNVGWWHVHRRPFCPSVVLDVGPLSMHWWVRPNYCHYYFGDYYATTYYTGWGLQPWYTCSFGFAGYGGVWVGRPCRYDPLFVFYNGYHRRHHDIDFANRMQRWHDHYRDHVDDRPRHTIREQQAFVADLQRHGRNREQINNVNLGRSLNDFAAHPTDRDQKFVKLNGQQRERQKRVANETVQLATLRHDVEGSEGRHGRGNDGQGRQRGKQNGETIALPGANDGIGTGNGDGSRHGRKLELPKNQGAGDQIVVHNANGDNGNNGNGINGDDNRRSRKVKTPDGPPGGGGSLSDVGGNSGSNARQNRRGRGENQSLNNDPLNGNKGGQADNARNGRGRRGGQNDAGSFNSLPGPGGNNQDAGGGSSQGENRGRHRGGSAGQNSDSGSSGNGLPGLDQGSSGGRNARRDNTGKGGNGTPDVQINPLPQGAGNSQEKGDGKNNSGRNNSRRGGGSGNSLNFSPNGSANPGAGVSAPGLNGSNGGNGSRSRHGGGGAGNSLNFSGNSGGFPSNNVPGLESGGNNGSRSDRGNHTGSGQFNPFNGIPGGGGQGSSNAMGGSRAPHSGGGGGGGGGNRSSRHKGN